MSKKWSGPLPPAPSPKLGEGESRSDGGEGFKPTALGDLPAEWEVVPLGTICEFQGGTQPPKNTFVYDPSPGYIRLLQIRDFENDRFATYVKQTSKLRMVAPDDVLLARYGASVGKILRGKYGAINVAIMKTFPDEERLSKDYLFYILQERRFQGFVKSLGGRAAQAGFNRGEVGSFLVPLPPLDEQRRIAHVLNTVQQAIAAQDDLVAAAQEVKRSLMRRLFTYGPGPEPAPTKETEVGEVPEHWRVVTADNLFNIKLGKMLSKAAKKGISPYPYLRNANVQWGHIDLQDVAEMDFDDRERKKFRLQQDDILVCEGGEIGRTAIWEENLSECYYQKAIHRLRPKDTNIMPRFFLYYMMLIFLVRPIPIAEGAKSTIAHLPVAKLRGCLKIHWCMVLSWCRMH